MKLSIALFTILSAALATAVQALPMVTCEEQARCLDFSIEQVYPGDTCTGAECEFVICMTVAYGGDCDKDGSISHTCEKASDECVEVEPEEADGAGFVGGGFNSAVYMSGITDKYFSCQTVMAGATAEFLMKDGNGECAEPMIGYDGYVGEGVPEGSVMCQRLEDLYDVDGSCTGNHNKECAWTVKAPACNKDVPNEEPASEEQVVLSTADEDEEYLCL
jgi:hypothetical protein